MKRNDIIGLTMTIFDIGLKPILSRHDCHVLFNKTLRFPDHLNNWLRRASLDLYVSKQSGRYACIYIDH